jgi:DNA polymerase
MKFEELGALLQWLSHSDEVPMARPGAARVLPRGAEAAGAMVILDPPDAEDAEAGEPLAGEAWQLGQAMLRAIGIDPDAAYRASISCFHLPAQRPDPAELDRCAAIARDHVRLVRPQRLILMGEGPARALLGEPVARARGRLHRIEGVPTVATFHPRWLMRRSADKALAWRDLLLVREAR